MAAVKTSASKARKGSAAIAEASSGAGVKRAASKKKAIWPKKSERTEVDPKTGKRKMALAVEARRAALVEQGYERLNGLLPPEAAKAWRELKDAGFVETRMQALAEGLILLRDTRFAAKARRAK